MIIIEDKNIVKTVYFPRNLYKEDRVNSNIDEYKLILFNRGTNKRYEFNVNNTREATYDFYSFNIDFSELPNGEYEYLILMEERNIASGLIRLGSLVVYNNEYNNNRTYIAYDKQ